MQTNNRYLSRIILTAAILLCSSTPSLAIPAATPTPGQGGCAASFSADDYVLDLRPYPSVMTRSVSRISKTGDRVVHYQHLRDQTYLATYYDFANAKFFTAETSNPTGKSLTAPKCVSICDIEPDKARWALDQIDSYIAVVINPNPAVARDTFREALRNAANKARTYVANFPGRQRSVNLTLRELGNTREQGVVAMASLASYDGCNNREEVLAITDWKDNRNWTLDIKAKKIRFSYGSPAYTELTNSPEFWKKFEESYAVASRIYSAKKEYLKKAPLLAYYLNGDIATTKLILDTMDAFRLNNKSIA